MDSPSASELFGRLVRPAQRGGSAVAVEVFGWLIFAEAGLILFAPMLVAGVLQLPELSLQAAGYFRLSGLMVGGLGMLYIASGRLGSREFVFASMLDRPLVPVAMFLLWHFEALPGALAILFAVEDFGSFLVTLWLWRRHNKKT